MRMSDKNADQPTLTRLVVDGVCDAELAALLWLLAERGVPLVIVSSEVAPAHAVRAAVASVLPPERGLADAPLAGGVVVGDALEDVLRMSGGAEAHDVADSARDLGVVVVLHDGSVAAAHYVRPVERDAGGHLQRRPPALLSARGPDLPTFDHFYWGITDELATRAGMTRDEFEDGHASRAGMLADLAAVGVVDSTELRLRIDRAALTGAMGGAIDADTPH